MPRGQPDFGVYAVKETVAGLADIGELAARLGSIVTFDRRGDVVWLEDFEGSLSRWTEAGSGTDHAAIISAESAHHGSFSCKITTGKDGDKLGGITHTGVAMVLSKIGYEVSFTLDSDIDIIEWRFTYYDGSLGYQTVIYFDYTNKKLQYRDTSQNLVDIATGVNLHYGSQLYHTVKFVTDLVNKKYNRVIFDNVAYDLSDIALRTWTSSLFPRYLINIFTETLTDTNVSNHIDNVIITQNEP